MEWHHDRCTHYGFEVMLVEHDSMPTCKNQLAKILWDVPIPMDRDIVDGHPDVSLQDKKSRDAT